LGVVTGFRKIMVRIGRAFADAMAGMAD